MAQILTNHITYAGPVSGTNPVSQGAATVVGGADDRMVSEPGRAMASQVFEDTSVAAPAAQIVVLDVARVGIRTATLQVNRTTSTAAARVGIRAIALQVNRKVLLQPARLAIRAAALQVNRKTLLQAARVAVRAVAVQVNRVLALSPARVAIRAVAVTVRQGGGAQTVALSPARLAIRATGLQVNRTVGLSPARVGIRSRALAQINRVVVLAPAPIGIRARAPQVNRTVSLQPARMAIVAPTFTVRTTGPQTRGLGAVGIGVVAVPFAAVQLQSFAVPVVPIAGVGQIRFAPFGAPLPRRRPVPMPAFVTLFGAAVPVPEVVGGGAVTSWAMVATRADTEAPVPDAWAAVQITPADDDSLIPVLFALDAL